VIGLRDYVRKNGFPGLVLGLSGGIDSALSAVVAVDALGRDKVVGVRLPSAHTSDVSMEEAQLVADRLGIRLMTLPIGPVTESAERTLARTFEGNQVKQYIELGTPQYRAYDERDRPTYGEVGRGPWCLSQPNAAVPAPHTPLDQGSDLDEHPPTAVVPDYMGINRVGADYSGSPGEQQIVNALLAQRTGGQADRYGALGSLMYGPLVRSAAAGGGR